MNGRMSASGTTRKSLALQRFVRSMQEVIRRGLDLWFAREGLPSWDEAKRRKR
jgi:hypothetical protein